MLIKHGAFPPLIPELEDLFLKSFEKLLPSGLLDWRYVRGPVDRTLFAIEMRDGNIISSYSLSPSILSFNCDVIDAALSMTTMTHPNFQGQGLFPKLAAELYESVKETLDFVYGFPNSRSHAIFSLKLGWESVYEIPTLVLRRGAGVRSSRVDKCTRVGVPIQEPTWLESLMHVSRSANYVNWRFSSHPCNTYWIFTIEDSGYVVSYAVVKQFQGAWDLVDFVPRDLSQAEELLAHVIWSAQSCGHAQINTWHPLHSPFRMLFEKFGFSNEGPVTYFGGCSLTKKLPREWGTWFVQMSDSDVY